jgi:hypothetical protein
MREGWKPAAAWQANDPGDPYRRLVVGKWECSVRTHPLSQGYLWGVKRTGWLGDWQHDAGFAPSLEEAMYEAETALQRASNLTSR